MGILLCCVDKGRSRRSAGSCSYYLAVLLMICSTRLESASSMENTWLAEATTGGGRELEKR